MKNKIKYVDLSKQWKDEKIKILKIIDRTLQSGEWVGGSEVKSLRINTGSIKESYIIEKDGELWLTNCFIKRYAASNDQNIDTNRDRKILVNKNKKLILKQGI